MNPGSRGATASWRCLYGSSDGQLSGLPKSASEARFWCYISLLAVLHYVALSRVRGCFRHDSTYFMVAADLLRDALAAWPARIGGGGKRWRESRPRCISALSLHSTLLHAGPFASRDRVVH